MSKLELPETLGWYRDTAKWILGLALGALGAFVGLAGFSEKISNAGPWPKTIFVLGCLIVLGATVAGVFFNLHIAAFGNLLEREHNLKEDKTIDEAKREQAIASIKARKGESEKAYSRAYWVLLFCFLFSFVAFTIIGLWLLFTHSDKKDTPITWAAIVSESIAKNPQEPTVHSVNFSECTQAMKSIAVSLSEIKGRLEPAPTIISSPTAMAQPEHGGVAEDPECRCQPRCQRNGPSKSRPTATP